MRSIYRQFGITDQVLDYAAPVLEKLTERFRQIDGFLEGEYDLEEAVRLVKRDTRHFAKRQLTWFRREKDVIWTDPDRYENRSEMWDYMQTTAENIIHY